MSLTGSRGHRPWLVASEEIKLVNVSCRLNHCKKISASILRNAEWCGEGEGTRGERAGEGERERGGGGGEKGRQTD